tara:strand:- start:13654 stop:13812 length:159 start_codon:yes stop_codon:yes gene_type:complete
MTFNFITGVKIGFEFTNIIGYDRDTEGEEYPIAGLIISLCIIDVGFWVRIWQ